MIIYWYPAILGLVCSIFITRGFATKNKFLVIIFCLFPAFFASPFITVTRGAAGAITASDITGMVLFFCLFKMPSDWKSPYRISSVRFLIIFMILLGASIWSTGIFYNFYGISAEKTHNLRVSMGLPLPILIACFRTFKILTLYSYLTFFYKVTFNEREIQSILRTIIFGSLLLAISQILTRLGVADLSLAYGDTGGTYVGPRILGHTKGSIGRLMAVGGVLALSRIFTGSKFYNLLALMVLTGGLILSGSRGGILVLIISLVPIFFLGRGRGVFIGGLGLIAILLASLVALQNSELMKERLEGTFSNKTVSTASSRTIVWQQTLSNLSSDLAIPSFGVGGLNFSYSNLNVAFEHAHNDTLTSLTELGVIGMLMFLAWQFLLTKNLYQNIRISSGALQWRNVCVFSLMVGLLFGSQFEPTFYPTISTLPLLRIILPLLLVISLFQYKQKILDLNSSHKV